MPQSIPNQSTTTSSTTTVQVCSCQHPLDYLFEKAIPDLQYKGYYGGSTSTIAEIIDRILDKGMVLTNCNLCCSTCDGRGVLASVETYLKYAEAVGLTQSAAVPALPPSGAVEVNNSDDYRCCTNVRASVETYLKYAEAVGLTQSAAVPALPSGTNDGNTNIADNFTGPDGIRGCCNGFSECVQELIDLFEYTTGNYTGIDRLLDKGVVEDGEWESCNGENQQVICRLVYLIYLINKYLEYFKAPYNNATMVEVIDRILDKGIVFNCDESGRVTIASVETYLKYAEAVGQTQQPVPALPSGETTTTTTVQIP
jgi:hypothetical protein